MKRAAILLVLLMSFTLPVIGGEVSGVNDEKNPEASSVSQNPESLKLPNIFIWAIPDDEDGAVTTVEVSKKDKKSKKQSDETLHEDELNLMPEEEPITLKSTTLKGFTEYVEGADDILYMDDFNNSNFVLNLNTPQQMAAKKVSETKKIVPDMKNIYSISKFRGEEYRLEPESRKYVIKEGNWSMGTSFDSEVSNAQLENATSLFTKYENKYFSLSSKYKKNSMMISQIQTDNFSVIPELKINSVFAIQEILSADTTRNRRSSELVLSINPLGSKDKDRLNLNVGAKHTYDVNSGNSWSQLQFTTNFKL